MRSRLTFVGLAAVALLGALLWGLRAASPPAPAAPSAQAPPPASPRASAPAAAPAEPDDPEPPPSPAPPAEVYAHQFPPGDGTGIHAFPKPGTKPIKSGILVPEGYELPPGYVRHVQHTDDGDELPPVLMFHPDHKLVDASGKELPLPPDLLVPPEHAPAGMPIRLLGPVPVRADLDEHNQPLR